MRDVTRVTRAGLAVLQRHELDQDRRAPRNRRFRAPRGLAADRRLRPARRLQLGRARGPRRLDRLAVPAALRQPGRVRAAARPRRRALVDPPAGRRTRASAATCPGTLVIETTFTHRGRQRPAARRHGLRRGPARPRPRASTRRTSCCARSRASGRGRAGHGARAAARVRARAAAVPPWRTAAAGRSAGPNRIAVRAGVPVDDRRRDDARRVHRRPRASRSASRCAGRRSRPRARPGRPPRRTSPRAIDDTAEGWRPGRPSTTSTRARTGSSCASAPAC